MPSSAPATSTTRASLAALVRYFLYLGTFGFGGPVALSDSCIATSSSGDAGSTRTSITRPRARPDHAGPARRAARHRSWLLPARRARRDRGGARVRPAVVPDGARLSIAYRRFGGLWWMQALFYGIGAAVIAIIAIAAYKLARSTNKRDPLLWAIFASCSIVTVWSEAELAEFFVLAGLVPLFARAPAEPARRLSPPGSRGSRRRRHLADRALVRRASRSAASSVLLQILLFFTKAGAFVFGSGLAIVPFLYQGVVQQFGWLDRATVPRRRRRGDDHARTGRHHGRLHRLSSWRASGGAVAAARDLPARLPLHDHPGAVVQPAPRQRPAEGVRPGRDRRGHRRHRRRVSSRPRAIFDCPPPP